MACQQLSAQTFKDSDSLGCNAARIVTNKYPNESDMVNKEHRLTASTSTTSASTLDWNAPYYTQTPHAKHRLSVGLCFNYEAKEFNHLPMKEIIQF